MPDYAALVEGLFTLEINTVRKDGMSGQKMPTAPNALVEIAQGYWDFLCIRCQAFGVTGEPLPDWAEKISDSFDWGRSPFKVSAAHPERPAVDPKTFKDAPTEVTENLLDDLREVAAWLVEMQSRMAAIADAGIDRFSALEASLTPDELRATKAVARRTQPEERAVLHRIRRNCDQLKEVAAVKKGPVSRTTADADFAPPELVQIRKAWDIGTEIILMQTVIQIDGDVVHRFLTGMDDPSRTQLHALHASAVDLSFKYWRSLIDTVARLAETTISSILGKGA